MYFVAAFKQHYVSPSGIYQLGFSFFIFHPTNSESLSVSSVLLTTCWYLVNFMLHRRLLHLFDSNVTCEWIVWMIHLVKVLWIVEQMLDQQGCRINPFGHNQVDSWASDPQLVELMGDQQVGYKNPFIHNLMDSWADARLTRTLNQCQVWKSVMVSS
jgi:hypothetical protein